MPFGSVHEVTPIQNGCPWSTWARPNLKYCEDNLCSYITAPANAWSNLAYIIFGSWMIYDSLNKHPVLFWIGVSNISVGITSFAFHASYTLEGQILDYFGMYGFILVPIVLNSRRLRLISKPYQFGFFSLLISALALLTVLIQYEVFFPMNSFRIQNIMAILIALLLLQEFALIYQQSRAHRTALWKGLFFIAIAFSFSIADVQGHFCDPENHFLQGHALWHLLSAVSLQYTYLFYRQFNYDTDPLLPIKEKL